MGLAVRNMRQVAGNDPLRSGHSLFALGLLVAGVSFGLGRERPDQLERSAVERLVHQHAVAWETGTPHS